MAKTLCAVTLTFCLIIVAGESRSIKTRQISLPDEPIVVDIAVRQKSSGSEGTSLIAKMKIEIDGDDKKMTLYDAADQMLPEKAEEVKNIEDFVPEVGPRYGIKGKGCATGFVKRGNVCFPVG